jgi:DNA repair exonuclease SbcCD nuclease subunit
MGEKYSTRLHNLINSISWAERLADQYECDGVINLGDFFDRPDLTPMEITALQDVYFSNRPHVVITGNHDANISNLEFSSVQIFKSTKARIITEPVSEDITDKVSFHYIPYLTEDKKKPLRDFLSGDKKKIVLSHNEIAGLQYGKFISQTGFGVNEILENCTLFINGHLHNGCIINNRIVLVGNLTGQNFNEDASRYEHYAYVLTVNDDGSIDLDPHVNPYAFNFYKLYINKPEDLKVFSSLKNNSVLSISCNNKLLPKIDSLIRSTDKIIEYRLVTIYSNSNNSQDEIVDFKVEDHLQQFIDYVQTKIPPSEILSEELVKLSSM